MTDPKDAGPVWFVETKHFTGAWHDLELGADDLVDLQNMIVANLFGHPVISGTGGLRKARFAAPSMHQGKRGALRVCYAYFDSYSAIVLVMVYRKNEKDDLTPVEKKLIRKFLKGVEIEFQKRFGR